MKNTNDGGFAFPAEGPSAGQFENPGMSLRDYFAAKALPIIRSQNVAQGERRFSETARECYGMADAMLAARGDV